MARKSQHTFSKRLREHNRAEKNRAKQVKRDARKEATESGPDDPRGQDGSDARDDTDDDRPAGSA